ncbi:toll/interleukin-1 receptor domain-containing protein [Prosthecobacter sp.]|uniref:toll/interleukin-1 receptor domain-containing protein n=1 Tax=Prosthecobacter sp. TaxID=1965333 RepID=UPI0037844F8D
MLGLPKKSLPPQPFVVGCGMADPEHLNILKQGVDIWNAWRERNQGMWPDLRGANLCCAKLGGANLSFANLEHANFEHADLSFANLVCVDLRHSDLNGVDFRGAELGEARLNASELICANFGGADLTGANLRSTVLSNADFTGANLSGANLCHASLDEAIFADAVFDFTLLADTDLSQTQGLSSVMHAGPSSIGIDTLYKSKGQIPEIFLRGCGVPDSFLTHAKALIGAEEGIQFYSCFISYSGRDDEFARRLYGRLQQAHIRVWFAPHDMQSGKKLNEQIDEAIKVYDKLLILLSPSSILSEWVMTELRKARKAERKTGKRKLFPIGLVDYTTLQEWECFDADGGQDLAVEVRQYFIPDFTNWKDHDAFEAAFARLLKDLRASEKAVGRTLNEGKTK